MHSQTKGPRGLELVKGRQHGLDEINFETADANSFKPKVVLVCGIAKHLKIKMIILTVPFCERIELALNEQSFNNNVNGLMAQFL